MQTRVSKKEVYYKRILLQIMEEPWESYSPVSTKTLDQIRAGDDKYLKIYLSDIRLQAIYSDKKLSDYDYQDTIDYLHLWNDELITKYVSENSSGVESMRITGETLAEVVTQVVSGLSAQQIVQQLSSSSTAVAGLISAAAVSEMPAGDSGIDFLFWVKLAGVTASVALVAVYAARQFDLSAGFKYYVDSLPYTLYGKKPPGAVVAYKALKIAAPEGENLLRDVRRFER